MGAASTEAHLTELAIYFGGDVRVRFNKNCTRKLVLSITALMLWGTIKLKRLTSSCLSVHRTSHFVRLRSAVFVVSFFNSDKKKSLGITSAPIDCKCGE